jgi:virginiamycin B lyase
MRLLSPLAVLPLIVAADSARPSVAAGPVTAPAAAEAARTPLVAADPDTVPIKEWTVPWERSRPRDPYLDRKTGDVWFVGQVGNYVGRLNPKTGEFRRYELEERALPHNVVVDADGTVWYAGNGNGHIGKMDPATGKVTRYPMPDSTVRDPHTLTFGTDGDLWFTAQRAGYVGRLVKATGEVKLARVGQGRTLPYGIEVDSKGNAWVNEFGTNKIAMLDPRTLAVREFELPNANARSRRIAVTPDDAVWYVDYARGFLGHLDPATGKVEEFAMPGGERSRPYAMTHDDKGRLWFVETGTQPNHLVGFDPKTRAFFSVTPIRSSTDGAGRNTVRHMMYHAPTREIWFGTDANTIGRAVVP